MRHLLGIFTRIFSFRSGSVNADGGSGFRTTRAILNTDAKRRFEKERLMGGIL